VNKPAAERNIPIRLASNFGIDPSNRRTTDSSGNFENSMELEALPSEEMNFRLNQRLDASTRIEEIESYDFGHCCIDSLVDASFNI
jgi:hypothetical protein